MNIELIMEEELPIKMKFFRKEEKTFKGEIKHFTLLSESKIKQKKDKNQIYSFNLTLSI